MKSLKINSVFNVIYKLLLLLFPLITTSYISHVLEADGVGSISYAQNIASYFVMFASLGIPVYGVREISKVREDKNKTNKVFTEIFLINILSSLSFTIAYYLMVLFNPVFQKNIDLLVIFGIQILFNCFNVDWFYQGVENYIYITSRSLFIKIISLILILLFVRSRNDLILYSVILCLGTLGNYIFNVIHLKKYVQFSVTDISLRRHFKPLIYLMGSIVLVNIYSKTDITMLGIMKSDEQVGLYSVSFKVIDLLLQCTIATTAVFLPRLSYYFKFNPDEFNNLIEKGIYVLLLIVVPGFIYLQIFADDFIPIVFGKSFSDAIPTVRILSILLIIKSFGDLICYQVSICTENEKARLIPLSIAAVTNILLNILLIPGLNANGAALASVAGELIGNLLLYRITKKYIDVTFDRNNIYSVLISGGIILVITIMAKTVSDGIISDIIILLFVSGLYIILCLAFKNKIVISVVNYLKKGLNKVHDT